MKIAIIGSGIAGLSAAYYLHREHDISLFESADRLGGHTATVDVQLDGRHYAIDTGFIVYNDWTYPGFIQLLSELGVASQATRMSFSVRCEQSGLEYAGSNLNSLFAQRRNLVNPRYLRMLADIVRFNREAPAELDSGRLNEAMTLGAYLQQKGYSQAFCRHYLIPMTAAIWSAGTASVMDFPLTFFVRFFRNHGLLNLVDRPQWRVIQGGSREYIAPLTAGFADRILLGQQICAVERCDQGVRLRNQHGDSWLFDQVVLACHSDQALAMLQRPTARERALLSALPYSDNDVVLHTDASVLPARRRAWAAWNYHIDRYQQDRARLTYNMNILQGIESEQTFCVSLNHSDRIDPARILARFNYSHPRFTLEGIDAQQQLDSINGRDRIWYCGAYWRNGFHEDGLQSALEVVRGIQQQQNTALHDPMARQQQLRMPA